MMFSKWSLSFPSNSWYALVLTAKTYTEARLGMFSAEVDWTRVEVTIVSLTGLLDRFLNSTHVRCRMKTGLSIHFRRRLSSKWWGKATKNVQVFFLLSKAHYRKIGRAECS